jgi:membrane associated rhomboid family serine protease
MIPIRDENLNLRPALATVLLLAMLMAAWVLVQGAGFHPDLLARSVCDLGMVPGEVTRQARLGTAVPMGQDTFCVVDDQPINALTPILSMFLHAGWGHLLGNMLFLWVFGRAVEDSMGRWRFLGFYLLCGLGAALAQTMVDPGSPIPMVGASGAISGVMGGYLLLYPRVRVHLLLLIFVVRVPAWLMLLWWIGLQLLTGLPQLLTLRPEISEGVAVWAHIGGFATGLLLVRFFVNDRLVALRSVVRRRALVGTGW